MRFVASFLASTLAAALLVGAASSARAQEEPPSAALLRTAASAADEALAGTLDRALRASLEALGRLALRGSVALDLGDLQIALGCEGESSACLGAVAGELGARYLLIPNLDRAGSQLVFTLALFDALPGGETTRLSRQAAADDPAPLVDGIEAALIELLPAAPAETHPDPGVVPAAGLDVDVLGGAVLLGVGAVTLAVGLGLGAGAAVEGDAYAAQSTPTEVDADRALARYRAASDLALGANLALAIGGAVAIGGLVWLLVGLTSGEAEAEVTATAFVSPSGGGLAVAGALPEVSP